MIVIQDGTTFEWDDNKERINKQKHKISFRNALKVFEDDRRIEKADPLHSDHEERFLAIGMVDDMAIIVTVSYTPRETDKIRIISARKATKKERSLYFYD